MRSRAFGVLIAYLDSGGELEKQHHETIGRQPRKHPASCINGWDVRRGIFAQAQSYQSRAAVHGPYFFATRHRSGPDWRSFVATTIVFRHLQIHLHTPTTIRDWTCWGILANTNRQDEARQVNAPSPPASFVQLCARHRRRADGSLNRKLPWLWWQSSSQKPY
jgi:hypothetical protein